MMSHMQTASLDETIRRPSFAGEAPRRQLRTILVYENLAAAVRAQSLIHRLATELRPEFELFNQVWKFELLRHPQLKQEVTAEAIEADVIIISASSGTELPPLINSWIESWLPEKIGQQASLIALFDQEVEAGNGAEEGPPSACEYLRRIAEAGGMDFFCNTATQVQRFHRFTSVIPARHHQEAGSSAGLPGHLRPELRGSIANGGF